MCTRSTAARGYIEDVIPLLDRGYGVGQMLPAGYSYYNVPYQYRDAYYDTDDYYYRYAPGAIYQVDRDTQLITAIASLLTGGLSVGQPLPPAYGVYNVPFGYRDTLLRHAGPLVPVQQWLHLPGRPDDPADHRDRSLDRLIDRLMDRLTAPHALRGRFALKTKEEMR